MSKQGDFYKLFVETIGEERTKWFFPRRISSPHGYLNPIRYAGTVAIHHIARKEIVKRHIEMPNIDKAIYAADIIGCKMRWPTYFVAEDFLRAIAATDPPEDYKLGDAHLPLDSMLLCLPERFMQSYIGKWKVPFIHICKIPSGNIKSELGDVDVSAPMFVFHFPVLLSHGPHIDYCSWGPMEGDVKGMASIEFVDATIKDIISSTEDDFNKVLESHNIKPDEKPTEAEDIEISKKMTSLSVKLLLGMTACPEHVVEATGYRPPKFKGSICVQSALWHPNWIGAAYKSQHEAGTGHHASPRWHWRKGHWRNQPYGKGRALKKLIWIEPILIHAEEQA
jgi:hypothetical protein